MTVYYNEHDPFAAQWLRNLINVGAIAPGDVDERSIVDVRPDDLAGYTQCHFFAGIGVWSHALRQAGWSDDRPVWTGSPPCQPFSIVGRQRGVSDDRHLAPVWLNLISQCQPPVVFGEQVAAAVTKDTWLDDLLDALEQEGYASGAVVLPACGLGAPHIRQRLWFFADRVGDAVSAGLEGYAGDGHGSGEPGREPSGPNRSASETGRSGGLAHPDSQRFDGVDPLLREGQETDSQVTGDRQIDWVADTPSSDAKQPERDGTGSHEAQGAGSHGESDGRGPLPGPGRTGEDYGYWDRADWLFCRDGRWRPVEPRTFPLADGTPARVGRLRAYGNAIVAPVATEIIRSFMEATCSIQQKR